MSCGEQESFAHSLAANTIRQTRHARIRELNDWLRQDPSAGKVLISASVQALGRRCVAEALATVRDFDAFNEGNDPHGEHDYGSFSLGGRRAFWKIDYYDEQATHASPDPADPAVTIRVLTIMLSGD